MFLNQSFELKAAKLTYTCVRIKETDIGKFEEDFIGAYQQAPKLFRQGAFIVEFLYDEFVASNKLKRIKKAIEGVSATLVGIKSSVGIQQEEIKKAGINVIHNTKQDLPEQIRRNREPNEPRGLMVQGKVRSGTQVYAKDKDIVVCGDVSHGSEIIASGNIFIYGTLKGKAIAGADGDESAQIFCKVFCPELISIAGTYIVCDDITSEYLGKSVSARMQEKKVTLQVFGSVQPVVNF
ncbi:MAG: septum site-determining protein MinC [Legionellales bacterium]|nr:septum site-determining protein MinC [Legionellales bacterium]